MREMYYISADEGVTTHNQNISTKGDMPPNKVDSLANEGEQDDLSIHDHVCVRLRKGMVWSLPSRACGLAIAKRDAPCDCYTAFAYVFSQARADSGPP